MESRVKFNEVFGYMIWCDLKLRYIMLEDACPLCKIRKEVPNETKRKTK